MNAHAITKNNTILKIIAVVLGYGLWSLTSQSQRISIHIPVPICFYNTDKTMSITAPDSLFFHLEGTRKALTDLNISTVAIHINAQTLHEGVQQIPIETSTVFLPPYICLLDYTPSNSLITLSYVKPSDQ